MTQGKVQAVRRATIRRAIELIDTTDVDTVIRWLSTTTMHDHLKVDPTAVRNVMNDALAPNPPIGERFGAWKVAQQLLQAAGLPHMPDDYADAAEQPPTTFEEWAAREADTYVDLYLRPGH